ncbi:hypothetical protein C7S18_23155 [Ahniella affigens]|uniref:Methyltransferase FkbM domain-containing protein n=1 Tax=Ahniella affigens TaxID=2021234 RepID=A0A2P1PYH8_9GAMM|nr:hypothetical protein C7S18_23155 [Ahniella affigens]
MFARRLIPWLRHLGQAGLTQPTALSILTNDLIGRAVLSEGRYERDELEAMRQVLKACAAGDVMVDVGANIGNHALALADLFRTVVCYEPHPITLHLLAANVMVNQAKHIRIRPLGLSDQDGPSRLQVVCDGNLGSAQARPELTDGEPIQLCTGDADLDRELESGRRVDFLKIDVEGMEPQVAQGLQQRLRQDQPLIAFEALTPPAFADMRERLLACGYQHFAAFSRPDDRYGRGLRILRRLFVGYRIGLQLIDAENLDCANMILAVPDRFARALELPS